MKKSLIILMVMIICSVAGLSNADTGWIYNPDNGHSYKRIDTSMTWSDAKIYAENLGGYLATITSQDENDFVWDNLGASGPDFIWLGGTDEVTEGTWQWVTGEAWVYENWGPGQPDDGGYGQDYLSFYNMEAGTWDDYGLGADKTIPFIVEAVPIPSTIFLLGSCLAYLIGLQELRRKFRKA